MASRRCRSSPAELIAAARRALVSVVDATRANVRALPGLRSDGATVPKAAFGTVDALVDEEHEPPLGLSALVRDGRAAARLPPSEPLTDLSPT